MTLYHNPVLLSESIDELVIQKNGIYVDVTFGGGGHSNKILSQINEDGRLIAFDQDVESANHNIQDSRFQFVPHNFRHLKKFLQYYQAYPVNGILADLGVSSHQFDTPQRGFSYRFEGNLDMRMNNKKGISARDIINSYSEERLSNLFFKYGELNNARRIAAQIVKYRNIKEIITTTQLVDAIMPILPQGKEFKPLSQIFQALRIEVNQEMEVLEEFLSQTVDALKPGGRLVIISYHSLEDRLVQCFMKAGNFTGTVEKDFFGNPISPFNLITRKAIIPSEAEIAMNPRARSAKLRIAERKEFISVK
jgi:16S rRNA (cytosine1402-N4)-methyltransferase